MGVAPDAQIIVAKVAADKDGSIPDSTVLAAVPRGRGANP